MNQILTQSHVEKASEQERDMKLGPVLIAYRTTPQSSTEVSSFYFIIDVMQEYPLH